MKSVRILICALLLVAVAFLWSCKPAAPKTGTPGAQKSAETQPAPTPVPSQDIQLHASDGLAISGTFKQAAGAGPTPACLLLHQVGKDRTTYSDLQDRLAQAGVSSLAIDFRGHGQSNEGGRLDYMKFTDPQWAAASADIVAALAYLRSQPSIDKTRIAIVGASIGANLAVVVAADDMKTGTEPPISCMVLLSPGLNYHSVQPLSRGHDLGYMPVLIVSGTSDAQSYGGAQAMSNAARGGELKQFNGGAHGTDLLSADPNMSSGIIDWLKKNMVPGKREAAEPKPATRGPVPAAPQGSMPGAPPNAPGGGN